MRKQFFYESRISDNKVKTPEGFLICENVPITKAGEFQYLRNEIPLGIESEEDVINVVRNLEDIGTIETIASFEGKPVTISHPYEFVNSENWKLLAVGTVQNVRVGSGDDNDKLLADLVITDSSAINRIENEELKEVSAGFMCTYQQLGVGMAKQTDLRGNHVAFVPKGRCGEACAVRDHAAENGQILIKKGGVVSTKLKDKLKAMFAKTMDEAMPEEIMVEDEVTPDLTDIRSAFNEMRARQDALERRLEDLYDKQKREEGVMDEEVDVEKTVEIEKKDDTEDRLSNLEKVVMSFIDSSGMAKDGCQTSDEKSVNDGSKKYVTAADSAMKIEITPKYLNKLHADFYKHS